jgi:hypothetical protein
LQEDSIMSNAQKSAQSERERKRARFERNGDSRGNGAKYALLGAGAIVLAGILYASGLLGGGPPATTPAGRTSPGETATSKAPATAATATALTPEGDVYRIPLASITTAATFFTAQAGSSRIPFFAVRDPSGNVHVAFDACQVCFESKRGYAQKGSSMLCQNCGKTFPIAGITENADVGGCHPIGVTTSTSGDSVVIARKDVEAGARWF